MALRRIVRAEREPAAAISRREFLALRTENTRCILELSCEPLYMRYVDAQAAIGRFAEPPAELSRQQWEGEPALAIATATPDQLFETLERELACADELRVLGCEWLKVEGFGRQVAARIDAFRGRGGRVELVQE